MTRRRAALAGLALAATLGGFACASAPAEKPRVQETVGVTQAQEQAYLATQLGALERVAGGVRVVGRGNFGLAAGEARVLPVGYVLTRPDDHGSTAYTIAAVDDAGVTVDYASWFSHRSFGQNLITKDRGRFVLPW